MLKLDIEAPDFGPTMAALEIDAAEKIRLILDMVGRQTIDYLRSLTDGNTSLLKFAGKQEKLVSFTRKSGERVEYMAYRQTRRHPGGWGDITGHLALSYGYEVDATRDGATLRLYNSAEYAASVEAREGYFVLSGVTEPGGPIDTALRRVIPQVAPGWTVA